MMVNHEGKVMTPAPYKKVFSVAVALPYLGSEITKMVSIGVEVETEEEAIKAIENLMKNEETNKKSYYILPTYKKR